MESAVESSRVFVRNLPPSLNEDDFRAHFSKGRKITDIRLFPARRIGYVGYKSPEDAVKAVKYFNKSFIRMSRINVEIARPIIDEESKAPNTHAISTSNLTRDLAQKPLAENPLKRKREFKTEQKSDEKLQQFLGVMQATAKSRTWQNEITDGAGNTVAAVLDAEDSSDDDIQTLKSTKKQKSQAPNQEDADMRDDHDNTSTSVDVKAAAQAQSDKDWLRSKAGALLDDEEADPDQEVDLHNEPESTDPPAEDDKDKANDNSEEIASDQIVEKIRKHGRLYLRNLPFTATEEDLRDKFGAFGELEEVHLPTDSSKGVLKGFAFLLFHNPEHALAAYEALDGKVYQGRLLHILAAQPKRENTLDEFAISRLPLKQQMKIKRRMESGAATHKWNPLYMNMNDVMSSISSRLGIEKSELLDATSSDAAVKQALAETHLIQEAKSFFAEKGVDLDSFRPGRPRGDTAILVKNFPFGTNPDEIRDLFSPHGQIKNLLIPPSATMALVEFASDIHGRAAFDALKYKRLKDSILFLEKAPRDVFSGTKSSVPIVAINPNTQTAKPTTVDLLQETPVAESGATGTLFVRNLNFSTTTELLRQAFSPLAGFKTARVKTKTDVKRPGEVLSMGFGFVEFSTQEEAAAALAAMHGHVIEGYTLDIRPSQRVLDHGEDRRKQDKAKALASQQTKVIVKNLPFETSKKDVRALLGTYGQLRSVRVPKKFDHTTRGFAFAEFTTAREAANAMEALKSTHLLGRRLHLEYAAQDTIDPEEEIEKMQKKVGLQVDKVAVQKLTGAGRRKFNVSTQEADT